jgi:hypothetical protein
VASLWWAETLQKAGAVETEDAAKQHFEQVSG